MIRVVEPELLDELPPGDPAAVHSRQDLRRVNRWMGNARWMAAALRARMPQSPRTILEIGAGDGHFMLQVARLMAPLWKAPIQFRLLDRQDLLGPTTKREFQELGWAPQVVQTDLRAWLNGPAGPRVDLITANLFLHHFQTVELQEILAQIAPRTNLFVACEPRRWKIAVLGTKLLWLIRCNQVTRHDGRVSVQAGFRDNELSSLWPKGSDFETGETPAGLASHLLLARRKHGQPGQMM